MSRSLLGGAVMLLALAGAAAADWQDPAALPRVFRNHCVVEPWSGRTYCENSLRPRLRVLLLLARIVRLLPRRLRLLRLARTAALPSVTRRGSELDVEARRDH